MGRVSIGTTNLALGGTFSQLVVSTAGSTKIFSDIISAKTYPRRTGSNRNMGYYAQASGQFLFNILIRSNNASRGTVSITNPFSVTSTGTEYIGNMGQAYSFLQSTVTISATRIYPFSFHYWLIDQTSTIYQSTANIAVSFSDSIIVNNYTLTAVFS